MGAAALLVMKMGYFRVGLGRGLPSRIIHVHAHEAHAQARAHAVVVGLVARAALEAAGIEVAQGPADMGGALQRAIARRK